MPLEENAAAEEERREEELIVAQALEEAQAEAEAEREADEEEVRSREIIGFSAFSTSYLARGGCFVEGLLVSGLKLAGDWIILSGIQG